MRWLKNTRRAQQRLALCKAVVSLSGSVRSVAEMADDLRALVTHEFEVPIDPDLVDWIRQRPGSLVVTVNETHAAVQAQAFYLSRYVARSGWLSPKGVDEYVDGLPRRLQLADEVFRLTEAGQILLDVLMTRADVDCWAQPCYDENPFELSNEQRYFLMHQLLIADGDFLIPWVGRLIGRFQAAEFSYLEAGEEIPAVFERLAAAFEPVAYLDTDRQDLAAVESARQRIETEISVRKEKEGSGSRRDQTSVPRLEWLVDLGVLDRTDRNLLTYRFSGAGTAVAHALTDAYEQELTHSYADTVVQRVLDTAFARACWPLLSGQVADASAKSVEIVDYLRPAYDAINSISGYCLLRTLNLAAAITAFRRKAAQPIEYEFVIGQLERTYKEHPESVHYTVDRLSTDYQVKLL